jgi:hypothetical protein
MFVQILSGKVAGFTAHPPSVPDRQGNGSAIQDA